MTKQQIAMILIFLKEAAIQIDNAIAIAVQAADEPTEEMLALILRDVSFEIHRFESSVARSPLSYEVNRPGLWSQAEVLQLTALLFGVSRLHAAHVRREIAQANTAPTPC